LFGRERVLASKVAGSDLTLPEAIVEEQICPSYHKGAVAAATTVRPLVLVRLYAHRSPVLLPDALASLILHYATQLHIIAGRYFLVEWRFLEKSLLMAEDKGAKNADDEEERRQMNRAIGCHLCGARDRFDQGIFGKTIGMKICRRVTIFRRAEDARIWRTREDLQCEQIDNPMVYKSEHVKMQGSSICED